MKWPENEIKSENNTKALGTGTKHGAGARFFNKILKNKHEYESIIEILIAAMSWREAPRFML